MHRARSTSFVLVLASSSILASANAAETIHVPADMDLSSALTSVGEGGKIVIAHGSYAGPFVLDTKFHVSIRGVGRVTLTSGGAQALRVANCGDVDLENLRFDAPGGTGLEIDTTDEIDVRRCRVIDAAGIGVHAFDSESVWIDRCVVEGTSNGVVLKDVFAPVVTDTIVKGPAQDGFRIESDDCVISDCTVTSAGSAGVFFASSSASARRGVVARTRVKGALTAIRVGDGGESILVRDCKVTNDAGHLERGIFVEANADGVVLAANAVNGATDAGIDVLCDRAVVTGNRVAKCPGVGVRVASSAAFGLFHGNSVSKCGGAGFRIDGGANAFTRNRAKKNAGGATDGPGQFICTYLLNGFSPLPPPVQGVVRRVPQDFATIGAAVAVAADGDTIVVGPGTWNESVTVDGFADLTLRAKGKAVIDGGVGSAVWVKNCAGIRIDGFRLRAAGASPLRIDGTTRVVVEDCGVAASTEIPIDVSASSAVAIVGCDVTMDADDSAIFVGGTHGLVFDCRVRGGRGIQVVGGAMTVEGCRVEETGHLAIEFHSAVPGATRAGLARGNTIKEPLYAIGIDADSDAIVALDNRSTGGKSGILVDPDADHSFVVANRVKRCGVDGILCSGNQAIVDDNSVSRAGERSFVSGASLAGALWSRNRATKSGTDGFHVSNDGPALARNVAKQSGGDGLVLESSGDNYQTANSFD